MDEVWCPNGEVVGVLCCGGRATSLDELTTWLNKHMLAVGPWPMVYHPLTTLANAGIRKVCLVTSPDHAGPFIEVLKDGRVYARNNGSVPDAERPLIFDLDITYRVQTQAGGIAQAIYLAQNFAAGRPVAVILGDNIIQGHIIDAVETFRREPDKATIFLTRVADPVQYGIAYFEGNEPEKNDKGLITNVTALVEKPGIVGQAPDGLTSNYAIIGIYLLPPDAFGKIEKLTPSSRGELEIVDLLRIYLEERRLNAYELRGWWRDVGKNPASLSQTGTLIFETGANNRDL